MAAFVFELEVVLEQRRRVEKDRQRALGEVLSQRVAVLQRVEDVYAGMRSGHDELRAILRPEAGLVPIDRVRRQASSSLHAIVLVQRAAIELAGINKRIEAARAELLKASISRKAVETLRERRYRAWKLEQDRLEAAAQDDLNVMRHGRRGEASVEGVALGAEA